MNRLRHIRVSGKSGLKGRTFDQPLTGADLFVGPNGVGKSTRLLAVLAVGRGLAESPTDTAREYLGPDRPEAAGALTFDAGEVSRDLAAKSNSNEGKRATFDAERLMGPHVARWDLADFARATDTDRAKFLERICATAGAADTWTPERVSAALRKSMGIPATTELPADHLLTEALALWPEGKPVGDWIAAAANWMDGAGKAEGVYTIANREQREAEPALKKAAADMDTAGDLPSGNIAAKREELARLEAQGHATSAAIAAATAEAKRIRDIADARETAATDLSDAEAALSTAEEALAAAKSAAARGPDTRALLAAKQAADAAAEKVAALPTGDDGTALADAAARVTAAAATLATAMERAGRAETTQRQADADLSACTGAIAALRALLTDAAGNCRHCQGEDPLGLVDKLATEEGRRADLAEAAEGAARLATTRKDALTAARKAHTDALAAEQAAERDATAAKNARALAEQAKRNADDAVTRETSAVRAAQAGLDKAVADAETAATNARAGLDRARAAFAAAEKRLAEPTEGAGAAGDLETLTAQREALRADYARVQREIEAFVRHEERQKAHLDASQRKHKADARFAVVKALKAALGEVETAVAESAFLPIQSAADEFLRKAGIRMEVVFQSEANFGARTEQADGSFPYVPFWSLSDAQKAEFGAALAVAFAKLTRSPWPAVILDKMEAIERRHLRGILRAAGAMVARGELANFLGACMMEEHPDPAGAWPEEMGVAVHWLGSAVGAVKGAA